MKTIIFGVTLIALPQIGLAMDFTATHPVAEVAHDGDVDAENCHPGRQRGRMHCHPGEQVSSLNE